MRVGETGPGQARESVLTETLSELESETQSGLMSE